MVKPEWVLNLQPGEDLQNKRDEWLRAYEACAEEFVKTKEQAKALAARVERAAALLVERREVGAAGAAESTASHDDTYYTEIARLMEAEDAALDGDFPLGNAADMRFASLYFSVPELARIQLGLQDSIDCGHYTEYSDAVLVKRGFLAELNGQWQQAARCYEGVSGSSMIQDREYACRKKAAESKVADPSSAREKESAQIDEGNIDALWQMAQQCKAKQDLDGAAEWFNRAIEVGQVDALVCAAKIYLDKEGGFYNDRLARRYLRRAADRGSVEAILALGDLELADTEISFWQQAAQLRLLAQPDKRPKRKIRAQHQRQLAWYRLAAEAGDADAINALSMACHLGYPEERDDEEAFLWASRGADAGNGSAMYQAAYFYENGFGTERDVDAALLLYTGAAEQGVRSAIVRLYEIYTSGLEHIRPDGAKAAHYLWLSGEGRD